MYIYILYQHCKAQSAKVPNQWCHIQMLWLYRLANLESYRRGQPVSNFSRCRTDAQVKIHNGMCQGGFWTFNFLRSRALDLKRWTVGRALRSTSDLERWILWPSFYCTEVTRTLSITICLLRYSDSIKPRCEHGKTRTISRCASHHKSIAPYMLTARQMNCPLGTQTDPILSPQLSNHTVQGAPHRSRSLH